MAAPIKAYGYVSDGAGGQTYVEQSFEVIARNIPSDYTYTKTAQKTIRDAEKARDEAVKAAKDAKASELAADDSAVEASTSAQSAGESASAAATSASNAAKSAGEAAKSASDAKTAADKAVEDAWPGKPLGFTIDGAYKQDGTPSPTNPVPIEVVENIVLRVTGADTSAEGTSLTITLPAEHPYLAALPDGTHDEIVVDKDGNASLVARVKATTTDNINKADTYEEKAGGADFQVRLEGNFKYGIGLAVSNVCVGGNVNQYEAAKGGIIKGGYVRMTKPEKVTNLASAKAYLLEIGFAAYIAVVTPVTYNLGKLDVPSLPETISNVWIDEELTTNMSMTYKQDVNIIIADLTAQIAALKGTNDMVHDESTASPDDAIDVLDNRDTLDVSGTVSEV